MPGDRRYQDFEGMGNVPTVVELEISLNDVLCETLNSELGGSAQPIRVCTLEDILAEKLRALLQQVPRNRSSPQDVFDIASMVRLHRDRLDRAKVGDFLKRKSAARGITPTKGAYNAEVRTRAEGSYESQIRAETGAFIPFDEAWAEVLLLVNGLDLPE